MFFHVSSIAVVVVVVAGEVVRSKMNNLDERLVIWIEDINRVGKVGGWVTNKCC